MKRNIGSSIDLGSYVSIEEILENKENVLKNYPDAHGFHVECETYSEYGSDYTKIVLTFTRLETQEEVSIRIAKDNERKNRVEQREQEEYNRLKAKFEGK